MVYCGVFMLLQSGCLFLSRRRVRVRAPISLPNPQPFTCAEIRATYSPRCIPFYGCRSIDRRAVTVSAGSQSRRPRRPSPSWVTSAASPFPVSTRHRLSGWVSAMGSQHLVLFAARNGVAKQDRFRDVRWIGSAGIPRLASRHIVFCPLSSRMRARVCNNIGSVP